jgi:phosphoglycerate dehydrogenase-like enzyme
MTNVLVTMPFPDALLERMRGVSPRLSVVRSDTDRADYSQVEVLYTGNPPRDLTRAPKLRWVQLHMAGVNTCATTRSTRIARST